MYQDHDYGDTYVTEHIPCDECRERDYADMVVRLDAFTQATKKSEMAEMLFAILSGNTFQRGHESYKSRCGVCFCETGFSYIGATYSHYPDCPVAIARVMVGLPANVVEREAEPDVMEMATEEAEIPF